MRVTGSSSRYDLSQKSQPGIPSVGLCRNGLQWKCATVAEKHGCTAALCVVDPPAFVHALDNLLNHADRAIAAAGTGHAMIVGHRYWGRGLRGPARCL